MADRVAMVLTDSYLTPRELWKRLGVSTPGTIKSACWDLVKDNRAVCVKRNGRNYYRRPFVLRAPPPSA